VDFAECFNFFIKVFQFRCHNTGYVTHLAEAGRSCQKLAKSGNSKSRQQRETNGISVDNLDFSTLSTDFSTGHFNREIGRKVRVGFFMSQHNTQHSISTSFYFFRNNHFDQYPANGQKKRLDKIFAEKIKNFQKKGLILLKTCVIMSLCVD